jgi:dTDP-4-dehydrorhamnose reductase
MGSLLVSYFHKQGYPVYGMSKGLNRHPFLSSETYTDLDLINTLLIQKELGKTSPQIVVHCAALSQVDICEKDPEYCYLINVSATREIANFCSSFNAKMIFFSSDFVFDGQHKWNGIEHTRSPLSAYGKSKMLAENSLVECIVDFAIIRPVLIYGYSPVANRPNIFSWIYESVLEERSISVVDDQMRTPTFCKDVLNLVAQIVRENRKGYFHIGGDSVISVYAFAQEIAKQLEGDKSLIRPVKSGSLEGADLRPKNSCFKNTLETGVQSTSIQEGIRQSISQIKNI